MLLKGLPESHCCIFKQELSNVEIFGMIVLGLISNLFTIRASAELINVYVLVNARYTCTAQQRLNAGRIELISENRA